MPINYLIPIKLLHFIKPDLCLQVFPKQPRQARLSFADTPLFRQVSEGEFCFITTCVDILVIGLEYASDKRYR